MDNRKYIGMDVHQASISVAVRDGAGKLVGAAPLYVADRPCASPTGPTIRSPAITSQRCMPCAAIAIARCGRWSWSRRASRSSPPLALGSTWISPRCEESRDSWR